MTEPRSDDCCDDSEVQSIGLDRRTLLSRTHLGIGSLALHSVLQSGSAIARSSSAPQARPKAKNVILLTMAGGPSQLDLFDPKPKLKQLDGQPLPDQGDETFAQITGTPLLLGSPYRFDQHGESGAVVSELLPSLSSIVDELTIVRSLTTDSFNHDPAQTLLNTGATLPGRPSLGAWLSYGLGSENSNLPGFIVMISGQGQPLGARSWGSGFLPTNHQGVQFRSRKDPVLFLNDPEWMTRQSRRASLDALKSLNRVEASRTLDPEIETRIQSYEMAFRMQSSVPELTDLSSETAATHQLYGSQPDQPSFSANCLLARRLVENGVRFVQLYHRGWDHHGLGYTGGIDVGLPERCQEVDQATTGLILDLKQRGLLDDTLVIWGGEFGRTPVRQESAMTKYIGRDHHRRAFTMLFAGGGVKPGITIGSTDELGYFVTENKLHIHDLHATILHALGINHEQLTFDHLGRKFRLTDVAGNVAHELFA
jgi:uncharacterized protein (DUF1501 family)